MDNIFSIFLFVLIILTGILIIWALIDVFSRDLKPLHQWGWILCILIAPLLGSILYFLIGRKKQSS